MPQPETKHIIHKLSVEFNVNGKEDINLLQDKSVVYLKEIILPTLEQVMEEVDDGRLIRIDRLNLQLDHIDPRHLKKELLIEIRKQFPMRIQAAMQKKTVVKKERSVLDTLEYFLDSGSLPWWDYSNDIAKIEATILNDFQNDRLDKKRLKDILTDSNQERASLQLSDSFFKALFNYYCSSEELWQYYLHLRDLLAHHFSPRLIRNYFITATLGQLKNNATLALLTDNITNNVLHQLHQKSTDTLQAFFEEIASDKLPPVQAQIMQKWQDQKSIKPAQVKTAEKKINHSINTTEDIYIQNAGLVLLHPFYVYLFEALEYTQDKNFENSFHQQQAALTLQYLLQAEEFYTDRSGLLKKQTTSRHIYPEHELALNKILCGISLEKPIESKLILSDTLQSQSEQLLQATIQHWPALKNTSPQGLIENFLLREGKLTRKTDGDWKLFVEYQTADILLSKLNWNYSLVKLPWMNNILWVDWA